MQIIRETRLIPELALDRFSSELFSSCQCLSSVYAERKHAVYRWTVGGGGRREVESTQADRIASSPAGRLQAACVRRQ